VGDVESAGCPPRPVGVPIARGDASVSVVPPTGPVHDARSTARTATSDFTPSATRIDISSSYRRIRIGLTLRLPALAAGSES
jgi:hypothetical protein